MDCIRLALVNLYKASPKQAHQSRVFLCFFTIYSIAEIPFINKIVVPFPFLFQVIEAFTGYSEATSSPWRWSNCPCSFAIRNAQPFSSISWVRLIFFFFSVSSISFDCQTQSKSIHGLSSIKLYWNLVRLGSIYYARISAWSKTMHFVCSEIYKLTCWCSEICA